MRLCDVAGCERQRKKRNRLCSMHSNRLWRHGDVGPVGFVGPGHPLKPRAKRTCEVNGCGRPHDTQGLCPMHYSRLKRYGDVGPLTSKIGRRGLGSLNPNGYRYISIGGRSKSEHRHFMELHLGRELLPHENVHHVNGDRADNRLENLELWSTKQPKGQRVEDKLAWALEIVALYGDMKPQRLPGFEAA